MIVEAQTTNIPDHVETLTKLKNWLKESYELTRKWKLEGRSHREYYRGRQLPADVQEVLNRRGQPELWVNLYQMIGNKVTGYKIDTRTEVKVTGRQYEDRAKGEMLSDILRSFTDSGSVDGREYYTDKRECDEDLMLYGLCAMEPRVKILPDTDKYGNNLKELEFVHIDADEIYPDPYAKTLNYTDARFVTRAFWIPKESLYPRYSKERIDSVSSSTDYIDELTSTYDMSYALSSVATPMVCLRYTWFKEYDPARGGDKVRYAIWVSDMILEIGDSPYSHQQIPTRLRRCFKGDRGEFFGMFRNLKPLQDQINYAANRVANMLGSSKLLVDEDAVDDIETFKDEYSKDNAVVVMNKDAVQKGKFKEISQADRIVQIQGRINELKAEAKTVAGFNEEALGVAVNRLSGYAIEQRQRTGLMGMMHYIDSSASFDRDVFAYAIELIKQYFDAQQTFYIVDKDIEDRVFDINNGQDKLDIGRYDVTVDFVPIEAGSRSERYKQNTEIMKIVQQAAPNLVVKLLPEFLKDADAPLAARVGKAIEEAAQEAQSDQAQAQMQLQMKNIELQMGELQSKIQLNQAKAAEAAMKAANANASMNSEPNGELEAVG